MQRQTQRQTGSPKTRRVQREPFRPHCAPAPAGFSLNDTRLILRVGKRRARFVEASHKGENHGIISVILSLLVVVERLLRRGGPFLQAAEETLRQVLGQVAKLVVLVAGRFLHHSFEALDGALGQVADCTSKAGAGVLGSGGRGCGCVGLG